VHCSARSSVCPRKHLCFQFKRVTRTAATGNKLVSDVDPCADKLILGMTTQPPTRPREPAASAQCSCGRLAKEAELRWGVVAMLWQTFAVVWTHSDVPAQLW
jgi:hypothetical protein